ncbi:28S ribosomal protein S9, mitochondrial [Tanacetum coccineum]
MTVVEVPQTLEYRGGQLNVAPVLQLVNDGIKCPPDRAFGDLIAISGITDDMLDSLMALKDLDDVPGLPPLSTIEDMHYGNNTPGFLTRDSRIVERKKPSKAKARKSFQWVKR